MSGDNINRIEIGFEAWVFLVSLMVVIAHKPFGFFIPWVTPLAWISTIAVFIIFIVRLFNN